MRWLLLLLAPALGSCSDLAVLDDPCEVGTDCVYPRVCCTEPRIPEFDQQIPYCEQVSSCDAYLPFLVEGNPCLRGGAEVLSQCAAGLTCCARSFTCQTEAGCAALPDPPEISSSNAECVRDPDCAEGEVCWGINLISRENGYCVAIVEAVAPE